MPRILILCEYATLNGGERSMLSTLDGIALAGYDVIVAASPAGPLAEALRGQAVEVLPLVLSDPSGARLPLEERRRRLAELFHAHRPALLHANSLAMGRLSGPVAAELGLPSISHLRDIVSLSRQAAADLNRHGRLLAVSAATRQFHVAQGLAGDKTFVLHNGVDARQFHPRPATGYLHAELGLPRNVPLLGTIGQIALRKGHDVLAEALSTLPDKMSFAWLIVGERFSDKDESRQFEERLRRAAEGSLGGRLSFLGCRDDVATILPELTLLVHPARQEPLGRALLEAGASGCAIVATEVGGTREIFPAESDALLVPAGDVQSLAAAMNALLLDPNRRRQLGENARKRVASAFSIDRAVAGLLSHYQAVLSRQ